MSKRSKSKRQFDLSSDSSDGSEEEWTVSGKKTGRAAANKKRVRLQSDSEPEEGEVSSEPGENEESDEDAEEDDGLDENYIGDEEDKKRLEKMSEKEREEELFKRAERRDAMKARQAVKKKLKERKEKEKAEKAAVEAKKTKKAAPVPSAAPSKYADVFGSDSEEESDSSLAKPVMGRRQVLEKKKEAKSSIFDQLIARRQQKQKTIKTSEVFSDDEDEDKRSSSSSSSSSISSRSRTANRPKDSHATAMKSRARTGSVSSSSGSSDNGRSSDSDSETRRHEDKPVRYVETLDELEKIRLSRHKLELWVHMPFFKDVVCGCFVRINIGTHEKRSIYRCAQIVEVVESYKIYDLGATRTNKGVKLQIGQSKQDFRLSFISNNPFEPNEFSSWIRKVREDGQDTPSLDFVENKVEAIKDALNYKIKDDKVLEAIVQSKKRFQKNPNNFAIRKAELAKLRESANDTGDHEAARKYADELEELEAQADRIDRRRSASIKSIATINERNRTWNLAQAEEAMKRESAETNAMQSTGGDPFNRLPTMPQLMNSSKRKKQKEEEAAKGPSAIAPPSVPSKPSITATTVPHSASPVKGPQPSAAFKVPKPAPLSEDMSNKEVDSLHSIHNFEINIDLGDVQLGPSGGGANSGSTASDNGGVNGVSSGSALSQSHLLGGGGTQNRRSLNLAEYKRLKGLI